MDEVKKGIYQHYKGGFYIVIGVAYHSETQEKLVTYMHLGKDSLERENGLWVRPLEMFKENVDLDGYQIPRFKYVGASVDEMLAQLLFRK